MTLIMVANGSGGVWEHERERNMAVEIPALGSTPSSHRRLTLLFATTLAEARQLMKCGNTCGHGDYGLSKNPAP